VRASQSKAGLGSPHRSAAGWARSTLLTGDRRGQLTMALAVVTVDPSWRITFQMLRTSSIGTIDMVSLENVRIRPLFLRHWPRQSWVRYACQATRRLSSSWLIPFAIAAPISALAVMP
jgi:hypothetical protein